MDANDRNQDSPSSRLIQLLLASVRWKWLRNFFLGISVVVGLWLTVTPEDDTSRYVQLALAAAALAGLMMGVRWPIIGVAITAGATIAAWLVGVTADPFVLTGFAVFVLAERRGSQRFPWWMFVGAFVVTIVSLGFGAEGIEDRFRGMLLSTVVLAASWVLGVRTRQVQREAEARSRDEERLRLARDVHDVLSHSLGAIGMRAGVSAHVSALEESDLRVVLREIESDARTALSELKGLLQRERSTVDNAPSLPLTAALIDIMQKAKRAEIDAFLDADDKADELPATVRTTVLRLVQESVTNVIRHSAATELTVTLRESNNCVDIEVCDNGQGAPARYREGHGLTGMRERVALMGGTMHVETSDSGFKVSAQLPVPAEREVF